MFGMLDYRANKLYLLLFSLPLLALRWFYVFGFPFINYIVGIELAESRILQIGITVISIFVMEIVGALLFPQIDKLLMFIFNLFVDTIPSGGRTQDEAMVIVRAGSKAVFLWEFNKKKPSEWTDEDISTLASNGFFSLFFKNKVVHRINMIKKYYIDHPDLTPTEWNSNQYLKSAGLEISLVEMVVTNPMYRGWLISYSILLYLIVFNPMR